MQGSSQNLFGGPEFNLDAKAFDTVPNFETLQSNRSGSQVDKLVEPVLPKHQFDRFLGHAFLSVAQYDDIKMPWRGEFHADLRR